MSSSFVLLNPLFWRVLFWSLVADWGSKAAINWLIEPVRLPVRELSDLVGKVYPYTPGEPLGALLITHMEHWHPEGEVPKIGKVVVDLVEKIVHVDVPDAAAWAVLLIPVAWWVLESLKWPRKAWELPLGLAFLVAGGLGNKIEVWLFSHATDWILIRFGWFLEGYFLFTNLADLMILLGVLLFVFGRGPRDSRKQPALNEQ